MRNFAIAAGLIACLLAGPASAQELGDAVRLIQQQLPYGQFPQAEVPGVAPSGPVIPQSAAVAAAMQFYPYGKPIGVRLLQGPPPVYAVKIRTQGQVTRVLVDAQTAQVIGQ